MSNYCLGQGTSDTANEYRKNPGVKGDKSEKIAEVRGDR